MVRSAASKVMWVGRTVSMAIGLALVLALLFGVATMALAAVPGDPLKLGQLNTINALTRLVGSRAGGTMLLIDNNSAAPGSRALHLGAEAGRAPLAVDAKAGTALNLSADELDGKDSSAFMPLSLYSVGSGIVQGQANTYSEAFARCDSGDEAIGGNYLLDPLNNADPIRKSWVARGSVIDPDYYVIGWQSDATPTDGQVTVLCVDLGAPH